MKILGIILTVLLVIVALLGFGLQMFLTKGLTTALNQGVFPAVKGMYGLDMSITNASVNLFKGNAVLEGFSVRNLKGYEEPTLLTFDRCRLNVELLSLIKRDPVVISLVEADGATLVIERNKEHKFNVKELADALKPVESAELAEAASAPRQQPAAQKTEPAPAESPTEPSAKPAAKPAKPIPIHIRRIAIDTLVKYVVDSGKKKEYDLKLRLTGSDIFTIPSPEQSDSFFVLRGSLEHNEDAFATDLNAIVKPLTDPKNPSFTATGKILGIDADFLRDLLEKNDMSCSSFSIEPSITCKNGQLNGSSISLILNDLVFLGAKIGDTALTLPINGTLWNRQYEITGAINELVTKHSAQIGKAVLQHELQKQLGVSTNAAPRDMLIGGLTNNVKEIEESPALQELIQQVVPGGSQTNAAVTNKSLGEAVGDVLSEQLGKSVKELDGNEAVKESLRNLGKSIFGK